MKIILISCFTLLTLGMSAQQRARVVANIPSKGVALEANQIILTADGCTLQGNVTQGPIDNNFPIVDEHNVPGIITQLSNIGGTWVIQCTAGPGFCFTYYTK